MRRISAYARLVVILKSVLESSRKKDANFQRIIRSPVGTYFLPRQFLGPTKNGCIALRSSPGS